MYLLFYICIRLQMCTLLRVICLFNMLVHLFTVLSFNCAFLLTKVRKRLYHNASQLKSQITFRAEIVSQVVRYQYISQTRSIDDFTVNEVVFVLVLFCTLFQEQGYAFSLATNLSLSPSQRSARVATVLVHRVILSRLVQHIGYRLRDSFIQQN